MGVAAKDVILELLRRLTVKGGVGKVMEYTGEGVESLTDSRTRHHCQYGRGTGRDDLRVPQRRSGPALPEGAGAQREDYQPLFADPDAEYDEEVDIDLIQAGTHGRFAPYARQCEHRPGRRAPSRWIRSVSAPAPIPAIRI